VIPAPVFIAALAVLVFGAAAGGTLAAGWILRRVARRGPGRE